LFYMVFIYFSKEERNCFLQCAMCFFTFAKGYLPGSSQK
jgi:hypothetical protein